MGKRFESFFARLRSDAKRFGFHAELLEERIAALRLRRPRRECSLATRRLDDIRAQAIRLELMEEEIKRIAGHERWRELVEFARFRNKLWHGRPPSRSRRERGKAVKPAAEWRSGVAVFPDISGRAHEIPVVIEEENG